MLGTKGGPRVEGSRANPSTLLLIGGVPYAVDCGSGVSRQLVSSGVPLNALRHIFITYHHSDHDLEYGAIGYNAWATGLNTPVHAYGPPPLAQMTRDFLSYMRFDIETRMADEGRPDLRSLLVPHEFDKPGMTSSFDISGDTTYSPELIELARNADVLVHEIIYPPGIDKLLARVPNAPTLRKHLVDRPLGSGRRRQGGGGRCQEAGATASGPRGERDDYRSAMDRRRAQALQRVDHRRS